MRKITSAASRFQFSLFFLSAMACSLTVDADASELQDVIERNKRSWTAYLQFVAGNTTELELAARENRQALAVAERMENPAAVAWCRLQQALIAEAQGHAGEGSAAAQLALVEFDHHDFAEGQAAAHIVLGRLAASRGDKSAATAEFDLAARLLPQVVPVAPASILQSDATWQASESSLGKEWAIQSRVYEQQMSAARAAVLKRNWAAAGDFHRQALQVAQTIYGPWHADVITAWNCLAEIAWCQGDFAAASTALQNAAEIAGRLFDDRDPRLHASRVTRQFSQEFAEKTDEQRRMIAESVQAASVAAALPAENGTVIASWDAALASRQRALGEQHLFVALAFFGRANVHEQQRNEAAALDDYQRGIAIFSANGVINHPELLTAVIRIAALQTAQAFTRMDDGTLQSAREAQEQVLRTPETVADEQAAAEMIAVLKQLQEFSPDARQRIGRAWKIAESAPPGQQHLHEFAEAVAELATLFKPESEFITVLRTKLATRLRQAGRLNDAQTQLDLAKRALESNSVLLDREVAIEVYVEQAVISLDQGELRKAEEAISSALAAWTQTRRVDSAAYLNLLRRSVWLHTELVDFTRAEIDAWRAVMLCQRQLLTPDHPQYASLLSLGNIDPELLKQKSAAIRYLQSILDLGEVHQAAGLPETAKHNFETVLTLAQHLDTDSKVFLHLNALRKLGWVEYELGNTQLAIDHLRAALDAEAQYGKETFFYADTAHSLAVVLQSQGNRDEALKYYDAAVNGKPNSRTDVRWAGAWLHRGGCLAAGSDRAGALESIETAVRLYDRRLSDLSSFRVGSRTWRARNDLVQSFQHLLTLALELRDQPELVERTWNWSMRIKGRALASLMRARDVQQKMADDPAMARAGQRGVQIANAISELALKPPPELSPTAAEARMERLQAELDGLLGEINRAASRAPMAWNEPTLASLRAALPPRTALVEFVRTRRCNWSRFGQPEHWGPEQYIAFVLPAGPDAVPKLFPLGDANAIDEAIQESRTLIKSLPQQLKSASEKSAEEDFLASSQDLYGLVLKPLEQYISNAETIYILSDGELQRLAFETLVDRSGRYLVENQRFAYLASAHDLLRPATNRGTGTWVFANPDYNSSGESASEDATVSTAPLLPEDVDAERGRGWSALPHAAEELKLVRDLLSKTSRGPVHSRQGRQASEESLKSLRSPRVLHLATHGFFVKDLVGGEDDGTRGAPVGLGYERLLRQKNPFLRSGLILAGANLLENSSTETPSPGEDGWVTAEEIAALDLAGTEFVVLSACETGLGDVKTGEGVHGLRQALLYAGAEKVITSLYRVPDASTQHLMHEFYQGITHDMQPLAALHAAELKVLRKRRAEQGAAHPYFWGSFIHVGNPR